MDDSADAFEGFRRNNHGFDVLITDMTMPKIASMELAKQARGIRPDVPLILCTAYQGILEEEAIKAGEICNFMIKPVMSTDLGLTIHNLLAVKTGLCRQTP
jgi:DNA-binding NtrC family response regulator